MNNIKQKFLKLTLSFICLFIISGCESVPSSKTSKSEANKKIVKVAIVLPSSGAEAALGQEYSQIIKMGLGDGAKTKIQVTSYDAANEQVLDASLEKILEHDTDIIIGPIFSEPTKKVVSKTAGKEIPIITLSNNPVLADRQVFVFGHAPMRQLEFMVRYLLEKQYQHYIVLLPAGGHSQTVGKVLEDMIASKGATLAKIEFYSDLGEDLERAIKVASDSVDNLNEADDNLKQPVLLIADDPKALKTVFASIQKYNLDKKAVIAGDNRLDIDMPGNINILYTGSNKMVNSNMSARAEKLGIKHISFMHILAYDAGQIVSSYIGDDYNKNSFLNELNTSPSFSGLSGKIHFTDSIALREYDILKRENGKYVTISTVSQSKEPSANTLNP